MRILILGPKKHGMSIGIEVLYRALSQHPQVSECRWEGSSDLFFSLSEIKAECSRILASIDLSRFDVVNMHFGKLEAEQLIPVLLSEKRQPPLFVYSVHSLRCDLFERIGERKLGQTITQTLGKFFDSYVFFGTYAKEIFARKYGVNGKVIFLPARHSQTELTPLRYAELEEIFSIASNEPFVALGGYVSPWKDWKTLLRALAEVKQPLTFLLAGASWSKHLGFTERRVGQVKVRAISRFIKGDEFRFLVERSLFGIFPYKEDLSFQGSGALPNYLAAGKACVVTSVANLPEMVGDAGICVPPGDAKALAEAIDRLFDLKIRQNLEGEAQNRADLFFPDQHASQLVNYFKKLLKGRSGA